MHAAFPFGRSLNLDHFVKELFITYLNEGPRFGNSVVSSKGKTTHYYSFRRVQYWTAICSGLTEAAGATFATAIGRYSSRRAVE
jgi:hypothetical protein